MKGRVLVVDDEPHILHYMRATLEAWGHIPVVASDGEEALALAGRDDFDLLISDLRMARGIPVASTTAGGLGEMLGGGAGLLVPAANAEALAEAVARILGDSSLRNALVARAADAVRHFTTERMAGEVLTVYRSCAPQL